MKKIAVLTRGTDLQRDLTLIMTSLAVLMLAACESAPQRTELAMAPPAFVPAAEPFISQEVYTVLRGPNLSMVEPQAGEEEVASCLQMGGKDEDALFYQWGTNRVGVDVASFSGGDRYEDFGEARMRYSVSLQKNRVSGGCQTSQSFNVLGLFD